MKILTLTSLLLLTAITSCATTKKEKDFNQPLPLGAPALLRVLDDAEWPDLADDWYNRDDLLLALDRSIEWTSTPYSEQFFPIEGISHAQALASLERFRELLLESPDAASFDRALHREFALYKSAGWDGRGGGVLFTAYFTPILDGQLEPGPGYKYPLYGLPDDLVKGEGGVILGQETPAGIVPYPERAVIEASGMLRGKGLELVWLTDPFDAFLAHVNGSAFIRLPDGEMARFGYAGNNGREYTSLRAELAKAGELPPEDSNLAAIRRWAKSHPDQVDDFLNRNERFVFFTPIDGNPKGSLNVEVSDERTLATDKTIFPRGALVFVDTHTPGATFREGQQFHRFMLDQDTGGAIRTAGRADIYLGVGERAESRAGRVKAEGQLYYLFLDR